VHVATIKKTGERRKQANSIKCHCYFFKFDERAPQGIRVRRCIS
jgi:hypothetical protein